MIFKNFADQDWIGFNSCGSRLDSDWKISQSAHLCSRARCCCLFDTWCGQWRLLENVFGFPIKLARVRNSVSVRRTESCWMKGGLELAGKREHNELRFPVIAQCSVDCVSVSTECTHFKSLFNISLPLRGCLSFSSHCKWQKCSKFYSEALSNGLFRLF